MAKTAQEKADLKAEKLYEKTHKRKYRLKPGDVVFNILNYLFFTLFTIACIFPFYYLFINTISDNDLVIRGVINFVPRGIHLDNYTALLNVSDLSSALIVSLSRTVLGTALMVAASGFIGYLVTKDEMWGRKFWYRFLVITMYFNAGLIPWFLNMQMLGLTNTFWAYIIPGIVAPYNIILVKTYIESIPAELEESAQIDERQAQLGTGDAELRHALEHLQQGLFVYFAQRLRRRAAEEDRRGFDRLFVLLPGVDHRGDLLCQPLLQYAQVGRRLVFGGQRLDGFTV